MVPCNGLIYTGDIVGFCDIYRRIEIRRNDIPWESLALVRRVDLQSGQLHALDVDSKYVFAVGQSRFVSVFDAKLSRREVCVDIMAGRGPVKLLTAVLGPARHEGAIPRSTTFYIGTVSDHDEGAIVAWDFGHRIAKAFAIAHRSRITAMLHVDMHGTAVVISTGMDSKVCVWNPETLGCVACLEGLAGASARISCLVSSSRGRFISLSSDGWLKVWSFMTMSERAAQ